MLSFKEFCRLLDEEEQERQSCKEKDLDQRKKKIKQLLAKDDHWQGLQ